LEPPPPLRATRHRTTAAKSSTIAPANCAARKLPSTSGRFATDESPLGSRLIVADLSRGFAQLRRRCGTGTFLSPAHSLLDILFSTEGKPLQNFELVSGFYCVVGNGGQWKA
jgi:hypothetical protein